MIENRASILHDLYEKHRRMTEEEFWATGRACLFFPCEVARLLTGRDPAEDYDLRMHSRGDVARFMVANGVASMGEVPALAFKQYPSIASVQLGDWVVVDNPDDFGGLGVSAGSGRVIVSAPEGLGLVPLTRCVAGFEVK